jgi:archaemetzincin
MSCIYIVPIQTGSRFWLKPLEAGIREAFGYGSRCVDMPYDLASAFDSHRRQYNSTKILLQIIAAPPAGATRVLAVTDIDLFIPILTFVFGEAQLDGIAATVSLHRLNSKFYGLPENRNVLTERLVKESIHELGHTFGLLHCRQPGCVMASSTYVEDIDQKSADMCSHCREQLHVMQLLQVEKELL